MTAKRRPLRRATRSRVYISEALANAWHRGDSYGVQIESGLPPYGPSPLDTEDDEGNSAISAEWYKAAMNVRAFLLEHLGEPGTERAR
jgi:hypothetical protein